AVGGMRRGDERLAEVASREHGRALVEHAAQVVQTPRAHEPQRLRAGGVGDVVEHPELVLSSDRRRPPGGGLVAHSDDHGTRKSAYRVKPPSTKIVCPVM